MKSSYVRAAALALALSTAGCSSTQGFLGTDSSPKGDIMLGIAGSGTYLATSMTNPYQTSSIGFSVGIHETNYPGPFNVKMTAWHNGFSVPCFEPHMVSGTLYTFSGDNANPATDPTTQPNPCNPAVGDIEQAEVDDGQGNSVYFYFELV